MALPFAKRILRLRCMALDAHVAGMDEDEEWTRRCGSYPHVVPRMYLVDHFGSTGG